MNIWETCKDAFKPLNITKSCWRLVEQQASSSTRVLVSSAHAHDRLEKLLDDKKPTIQLFKGEEECKKLHYLLLTPFRYPPLRFGSRFGTIYERGIFYASTNIITAATEKAFYRIFFAKGSHGEIGNKNISFTSFESKIITSMGLDLTAKPFAKFQNFISSKTTYKDSQALGPYLRNANIHAFITNSARTKSINTNLNVISPLAFDKNHDISKTFDEWICFYTKKSAELYMKKDPNNTKLIFSDNDFFVDGFFPHPPQ